MAVDLVESFRAARQVFEDAERITGTDFLEICRNGDESVLNSTRVSQPAIFLHSMAVLDVLASEGLSDERFCVGLRVVGTAGLSLGEYSALVFAGSLSFEDALRVVVHRGECMQRACDATQGGMVSVLGLAASEVETIVGEARAKGLRVGVANYNSPDQTVISGEQSAVDEVAGDLKAAGAKRAIALKVAGAYHSELMQSATQELSLLLNEVSVNPPRIPFYSNVTGGLLSDPDEIRQRLIEQVEKSVRWESIIRALVESGVEGAYELGPGRVLRGLVRNVTKAVPVVSIGTNGAIEENRTLAIDGQMA